MYDPERALQAARTLSRNAGRIRKARSLPAEVQRQNKSVLDALNEEAYYACGEITFYMTYGFWAENRPEEEDTLCAELVDAYPDLAREVCEYGHLARWRSIITNYNDRLRSAYARVNGKEIKGNYQMIQQMLQILDGDLK